MHLYGKRHAADELGFVLSRDLPPERHDRMREATEELHASRKVREIQMADVIKEPLDERMFAHDGDDFLAVAMDCDAEARLQVVPAFVTAVSLELPLTESQLPGIGRRLTLLMRPRVVAEARLGERARVLPDTGINRLPTVWLGSGLSQSRRPAAIGDLASKTCVRQPPCANQNKDDHRGN
jgi:hypothetical protein